MQKCPARPAGCRSDDGRNSVLFDQFAHMFLVLLHLFVPVFHGEFLNAAVAAPCVPASAAPRSRCDYIITPALELEISAQGYKGGLFAVPCRI